MKTGIRQLLIVSIAVSATAAASYASIRKPVYPATEEAPSEEVISSAPGYRGQGQAQVDDESVPAPPASVAAAPVTPSPAAAIEPAPPAPPIAEAPTQIQAPYDSVPAAQVEPLVRRLRIVETLVSKYGRAYDYRALTVSQLEALLGQLDTQTTRAAALRQRMGERAEMKKEVREEENTAVSASDNSIGSEAPEIPIPPPPPSE